MGMSLKEYFNDIIFEDLNEKAVFKMNAAFVENQSTQYH